MLKHLGLTGLLSVFSDMGYKQPKIYRQIPNLLSPIIPACKIILIAP